MNLLQRIGVGLRACFDAWFVEGGAEAIAPALQAGRVLPATAADGQTGRGADGQNVPPKPAAPAPPGRSEALTLLEVLQREARLVDFLMEDLSGYDDAQVGAAVRNVHRDSAAVLARIFSLKPAVDRPEGAAIGLQDLSPASLRLVGKVRDGVQEGTLVHIGWRASKLELPTWSGPPDAERIVAPAEIEV